MPHRAFRCLVRGGGRAFKAVSPELYYKTVAGLFDEIDAAYEVRTRKGPLFFHCTSETVRVRARVMLVREPDTLAWIETFLPDQVLWDIGANIGVFTLYAARVASARVVAFDPLPFNYAGLVRNLALNALDDRVMAFCVALTEETRVAPLRIPAETATAGGAGGVFDGTTNYLGEPIDAALQLATLGYSTDDLLENFDLPFPNHIKIDVDGDEGRVIAGARNTLRDPRLKSLMVEISPDAELRRSVFAAMKDAGLISQLSVASTSTANAEDPETVTNNFFVRPT